MNENIEISMIKEKKLTDERKNIKKSDSNGNKKKQNNGVGIVLLVSILLSFVCGAIGAYLIVSNYSVEQVVKTITTSELVETSIATSVDKVYGATVVIVAYKDGSQISTGTGFIYKKDNKKAYIMTNNHVIDKADSIEVEFNNKTERIKAEIVGGEVYSDIAVLTVDKAAAEFIVEIGDSKTARLGDTIFTVGSPMGVTYKGTVTKGILSGKERLVEVSLSGNVTDYYMKVLQLDAAVNPGNSGGPLCDVSGKVIGIISLKIVQNEVEGMGFAIPIEDALEYANTIEKGGSIVRPYVGVGTLDLTDEYNLWKNKITIPEAVDDGVAVIEVVPGSPADKAKLKKGDIITKIGDENISGLAEFRYELYKYKVGDKVQITYYRKDVEKITTITLGKSE